MIKGLGKVLLVLFALSTFTELRALPVYHVVTDGTDEYEFQGKNVLFRTDSDKTLSIDDIKNKSFKPFEGPFLNDKTDQVYWLKFPLKSNSTVRRKWIIEIIDAHQELVDIYFYRGDSLIKSVQTGQKSSKKKLQYSHKNHIVDVPLKAKDDLMVYIRFESSRVGTMIFKLRSNGTFSSYGFKEYYILGVYYGILILICLLNLILFLFLKEKIYIIYLGYVFAWLISSLNEDGIGQHFFWTDHFWFDKLVLLFIQPILIVLYVLYSVEFFTRRKNKIASNKFIYITTGVYLLIYSIELLSGKRFAITTWLMFVPLVRVLIDAFRTYKNGYTPAQFFILGNLFIIVGLFIRFLQDQYVIKFVSYYSIPAIMVVYSKNIGMILEIIALTLALGDRFSFIKHENELQQQKLMDGYKEKEVLQEQVISQLKENEELSQKVNKELENKVQERTVELQSKSDELVHLNEKLKSQAEQISEMNRMLDLDNYKLKKQVDEVNTNRVNFKKVSFEEFSKLYPDKLSVLRFLNDNKWKEGYTCRKCGNEKHCDGNSKYSRRCTKCRYDESITAFTIFHRCKFPLEYALYIVSKTVRHGKDLDTLEVSEELGLRQNTVRTYKAKVLKTLDKNKGVRGSDDILLAIIFNPA